MTSLSLVSSPHSISSVTPGSSHILTFLLLPLLHAHLPTLPFTCAFICSCIYYALHLYPVFLYSRDPQELTHYSPCLSFIYTQPCECYVSDPVSSSEISQQSGYLNLDLPDGNLKL